MLSIILYRILFLPFFLLLAPYYAYRMARRGGYRRDFSFRFGMFQRLPKRKFGKRRIWIQAVSVGEVKSIEKLINLLHATDLYEIVLTTTTSTSYEIAKKLYSDKALFIGLFPFDFWLFSWLAWKNIFPHIVVLVDSEIWPEHVWQASKRDVPVVIVNGRMSDKAFSNHLRLKSFSGPILDKITYVFAADQLAADRFREIGVSSDRIKVSGNMKFDNVVSSPDEAVKEKIKRSLGFSEDNLVLLGSSTWEGEEAMLLNTFRQLRVNDQRWRLLLVPRHAERRQKITHLLQASGLLWHQRSTGPANGKVDVCLADTTGELSLLTAISDVVFIGKSLSPHEGGQSPLDAASHGIPMVYGDRMSNFKDICLSLEQNKCAIKVDSEKQAIAALSMLANDEAQRDEFSNRLKIWHKNHIGASEFVSGKLQEIAFKKA